MKTNFKIDFKYVKSLQIIEGTNEYMSQEHLIKKKLCISEIKNGIILPYKRSYDKNNTIFSTT